MIKVLTTKYGQLIAKVDRQAGITTILDGDDMAPIARVQSVQKEGVVRAINQIASFLRKKQALQEMGVQLEAGAAKLESIDSGTFEDSDENGETENVVQAISNVEPAQPVQATPAAQPAATPVQEAQEEPKRGPGRPKGTGQGKGRRGRKPGQKVKRNPELSW